MKNKTGIWIDGTKAVIINFNNNENSIKEIESNIATSNSFNQEPDSGSFMGQQHISHERTFEERKNHQTKSFLAEVIAEISQADEIFIFGPAEMKIALKQKIEASKSLAPKLLSVETSESMTTNQLVAHVKAYYKL